MKKPVYLLLSILMAFTLQLGCSDVAFEQVPQQSTTSLNEVGGGTGTGVSGVIYETFFAQTSSSGGQVDILFVVDNSTSMTEEQRKLGDRLGAFVGTLAGLDWQIGITTTDVSNGTFGLKGGLIEMSGTGGKVLTPQVPNYEDVFNRTVVRHETINCVSDCPSSSEEPIAASILAMEKHDSENAGLFRSGADLAIIILSDEDEMSTGPIQSTNAQNFMDAKNRIFGNKNTSVYGIITIPGDRDCFQGQDTNVNYGDKVFELTQLTNGLVGSICESDYTQNLRNIGSKVVELMQNVALSKDPIPGTVSVSLVPDPGHSWSLNGRMIEFEQPLPEGTKIDVSYEEIGSNSGQFTGL